MEKERKITSLGISMSEWITGIDEESSFNGKQRRIKNRKQLAAYEITVIKHFNDIFRKMFFYFYFLSYLE